MSSLLKSNEHKERRLSVRVTPDPLLIIRLPSGNQGIVLDVSHEGVGFLASAPVEEAQTIRFEISPRSTRGSQAAGQLMWKDRTGTRGGLRFTHLPEELRSIIRTFIPHEQPRPALRVEPEALASEVSKLEEPRETLPLVSRVTSRMWRLAANSLTTALACLIVLSVWYSVDRGDLFDSLSHLKRRIPAPLFMHIHRTPHWLIALTKSVQPPPTSSAVAKVPVAQSTVSNTLADVAVPDDALPQKAQPVPTDIADPPQTPVPPATPPRTNDAETSPSEDHASVSALPALPALKDQSQTQLALARTLLKEDSDPANQTKAVQLLWQAVEKGNLAAEIELAGVYLEGQAVPKSCSQAAVLLTAARNHKNALAEQKLRDMPQYGCEPAGDAPNPPPSEDVDSTQ